MEKFISPTLMPLYSFVLLIVLWMYFIVYSYRHKIALPWEMAFVLIGVLLPNVGFSIIKKSTDMMVFQLDTMFVVSVIGVLWNVGNVQTQFKTKTSIEFFRLAGIGLVAGLLLGFGFVIVPRGKFSEIPQGYTINALIAFALQVGIAEELLFRSFLLSSFRKYGFNSVVAIGLQAMIFSALHFDQYFKNAWIIPGTFSLAALGGFYTWKTNKLISSVIAHITINLTILLWQL